MLGEEGRIKGVFKYNSAKPIKHALWLRRRKNKTNDNVLRDTEIPSISIKYSMTSGDGYIVYSDSVSFTRIRVVHMHRRSHEEGPPRPAPPHSGRD